MLINPEEREVLSTGKHRSSVRRHRAAHEGEFTSLLVRLVPAWTIRPPRNRPPQRPDSETARRDEISIDLRSSRQPFDQDEVGLFAAAAPEAPATAPASSPGIDAADAAPSTTPPPGPAAPPLPTPSPAVEPDEPPVAMPGDRATPQPPPASPQPDSAEEEFRLPIWDPTGEHTARGEQPRPSKRRFTFADLLGFGIDTDDPPLVQAPPVADEAITGDETELFLPDPGPDDWADLPRLADVATAEPLRTNELVQRLWDATAEHPVARAADTVAAPLEIQETFRSNRTFRWTVVAGALVVLMLVVAGIQALGKRPVTIAETRAAEYAESLERLDASLTGFQAPARTILNPATPVEELGLLTEELLTVGSLAREVAEITAEPLPEPSLLGPSTPIDRLRSPRELLQQAAEGALAVERRLGDALTYRVLINQAFVMPDLPVAANEADLGSIGADLAVAQAKTEQVLAQVPGDPFFATYTESATALADTFEEWQVQYLSALREGDVAAAGILRRDWLGQIAAFRADLATPLMAVNTWASEELRHVQQLIDLARERLAVVQASQPAG